MHYKYPRLSGLHIFTKEKLQFSLQLCNVFVHLWILKRVLLIICLCAIYFIDTGNKMTIANQSNP